MNHISIKEFESLKKHNDSQIYESQTNSFAIHSKQTHRRQLKHCKNDYRNT